MAFRLPMIDVNARWAGPLACLDDDAAERAGDGWPEIVAEYIATGAPDGLSADGCNITLRPLSAAEEDAAEAEAGPPSALAGFIYRAMKAKGVDLDDGEAVARAVSALPPDDQAELHRFDMRTQRLRALRVGKALVAADFTAEGMTPAETLAMVKPSVRDSIIMEAAAHLDRMCTLTPEGKAPAGDQ